ncbi:hypothetical protein CSKR_110771 [Clonorchis sinensis]|uniref:Uncharacterized protein n=1 Tax=Clonorchis sinensis TaxID=79923 RepID=A0A3R7D3Q0_CLOSI|nr:hypothetical protein CSKR_110771 [Clonorchis sinensis]
MDRWIKNNTGMYCCPVDLIVFLLLIQNEANSVSELQYRTISNHSNICTNLFEDDVTRTAVLRFLGSGNESNVPIPDPLKIGLTELRDLHISGLEHTKLVGPIRFENVPTSIRNQPDLRIEVTLSFDHLVLTGGFKLRGDIFPHKPIHIQIKPVDLWLVLDFRRYSHRPLVVLPGAPLATVRTVRITRWNGIRINGKGVLLKLFRILHADKTFDGLLKRQIEKTVRKRLEKKLR